MTGEGPEYFAEYKIRALREIVDRTGLDVKRICDFGSGIGNSIPYFHRYFPEAALTSSDVTQPRIGPAAVPRSRQLRTDREQPDSGRAA